MHSYLACVRAAVEPGADHVGSDVLAVHVWFPTLLVRIQPHACLLQSGVTVCLCENQI